MAAPRLDIQFPLPDQLLEQTYNEIVESLTCPPCSGAQIRPSGLHPSAALNLGDAIADITSHLTSFTSGYSIILVILKMIGCMIEVICAINNPFALIPAVVRLFAGCLPEFVLIFPFFVVPCIIFCFIKIFLAVTQYIITYIDPIITDIIDNIENLVEAFQNSNEDVQEAVAFKLAGLIQELASIVGILSVLGAIFDMIEALLSQGVGIPCSSGSGGSCSACTDPLCPSPIQVDSFSGADGSIFILYGARGVDFTIRFSSASRQDEFLTIRNNNLFPTELNYTAIDDVDDLPYVLRVSGSDYAVSSIDSTGTLILSSIPNQFLEDGYLSSVRSAPAPVFQVAISEPEIRFATDTPTFSSSMVPASPTAPRTYIEIQETRSDATINTGTWELTEFIDEYNVLIQRDDGESWAGSNAVLDPSPFLVWRLIPTAPGVGDDLPFTFTTNHDVLLKHGLIGTGCHPAVQEAREMLLNQYPDLGDNQDGSLASVGLDGIPDLNGLIDSLNDQLDTLGPANKDYISDNYDALRDAVNNLDLATPLNAFGDELIDYAKSLCPLAIDVQNSGLSASPKIQEVGKEVVVSVTPLSYSGAPLSFGLPPGVLDIEVEISSGELTELTEVLDEEGDATGTFQATLTSVDPQKIEITAKVCDKYIADFDGTNLVTRVIEVEFVLPAAQIGRDSAITGEVTSEPLGKATSAGE